ncbi:homeobox-leucine zipper protein HOX19-like [Curcuma longa]|uniref:homeobox-leucine zipper protein HOX19-like n=1 Tax=Curcuma longa TaxID=136217 RepID=UPI003D9EFB2D
MDMNPPQHLCDTGLSLGLAIGPAASTTSTADHRRRRQPRESASLTLSLAADDDEVLKAMQSTVNTGEEGRPLASPCSAVSSFSSASAAAVCVKKEKDVEEVEAERVSNNCRASTDEEEDNNCGRKKLRLTKEQSALLEDRFKEHSTLNPKQKQALAKQLNLRPRQVEVWFQNRRARTKLKQTEVDCEFLKRCYETLTTENQRLQKELQELRALKFSQQPPFYMQFPAATLSMCPSCERIGRPTATATDGPKIVGGAASVVVAAPPKSSHHFFNPFTNSAAC